MSFFPIYLNLRGKKVVVVGGGKVAERKVFDLLQAGSEIYVISPFLSEGLSLLLKEGQFQWVADSFSENLVPSDAFIVIAATDEEEINQRIYDFARGCGIMVNVVDQPELCDFYLPSVVKKGDITIAISTGGKAPSFSRALREKLERMLPDDLARALEFVSDIRDKMKEKGIPDRGKILLGSAREIVERLTGGESWSETREEVEGELKDEV